MKGDKRACGVPRTENKLENCSSRELTVNWRLTRRGNARHSHASSGRLDVGRKKADLNALLEAEETGLPALTKKIRRPQEKGGKFCCRDVK